MNLDNSQITFLFRNEENEAHRFITTFKIIYAEE